MSDMTESPETSVNVDHHDRNQSIQSRTEVALFAFRDEEPNFDGAASSSHLRVKSSDDTQAAIEPCLQNAADVAPIQGPATCNAMQEEATRAPTPAPTASDDTFASRDAVQVLDAHVMGRSDWDFRERRGSVPQVESPDLDDWPDIEAFDRPIDQGSPTLPSACLPERVEKLTMTIACALGVPLTYVVVSLLVCVATLVGCWRRIRVSPAWVEPSTLAAVLVGPPGLLKSHVIDTMLHELRAIQAAEHSAYQAYCTELRAKRDVVWAQEQIYKRAVVQSVETGQPLPFPPDMRLADLQIPGPPALVSTSGTPQALRDLAARSRTGLLSAPDELPRFLKDHGSPSARGFLMTAYDGRHDATDLVTRGRIAADHYSISLLATVQPAMLPQIVGPDDGLLARFAWVPASRGDAMPRSGKRVPTEVLLCMFQKIRDLVPQSFGANVPATEVVFEPKAAEVLRETRAFYDVKARAHEGLLASGYAKAGGLAARLASAIDLATFALSGRAHPGRISLQSVEAAATLVEAVLMPGAEAVFGLSTGSIEDRDARDLLAILRRRGWREVNQRDLQRACSGRLARADVLEKAIRELAERGIVRVHRVMPGPAGGAPRKVLRVNPKVF